MEESGSASQNLIEVVALNKKKIYSNLITGLERPLSLQRVETSTFRDNRQMKVARLSALRTGRLYFHRKYSWYSFLLEVESTPGS